MILYARLRERFQKNSEIEKEKLQTEVEQLKQRSKERPREYYGRIDTLATELWTVIDVNVTNDMVRREISSICRTPQGTSFYS